MVAADPGEDGGTSLTPINIIGPHMPRAEKNES